MNVEWDRGGETNTAANTYALSRTSDTTTTALQQFRAQQPHLLARNPLSQSRDGDQSSSQHYRYTVLSTAFTAQLLTVKAALSASLCYASTFMAPYRNNSTTLEMTSTPCPPLPLCLPAPLLTVVLQYLPLTHKLTACSQLCRSFPRLEPAHFSFDGIDLQPRVMLALAASPPLLRLLANLACVQLHDAERSAVQRQSRVLHHPSKQAWFPRAQRVAMTGMVESSPFALLHSMLVPQPPPTSPTASHWLPSSPPPPLPLVRLPLLHTLRLNVVQQRCSEPREHTLASMQPLALLPLLRTLVVDELEGGMDYAAFRFVCSLPLSHLDLHGVHVTPTATPVEEAAEAAAERLPVTDTWRVLRLATFDPKVWSIDVMLDTLLQPYMGQVVCAAAPEAAACAGLQYISLETPQPGLAFSRLAAVRTLRSLDVRLQPRRRVPSDSGALPVAPFLLPSDRATTATSPHLLRSLPALRYLRHLRIRNNLPAQSGAPHVPSHESRVTPALPYMQLLTAYSEQLRVLVLSRLFPWDHRLGVLEAVGQCSQLRVFEMHGSLGTRVDERDPPSSQRELPRLPHLHTLRLRIPAHPSDVLMLVTACSGALEDYRQTGPYPLPLTVVRAIGMQCPRLRRLECPIEAEDTSTAVPSAARLLPASPSLLSSFPCLISLIVHAERRLPQRSSAPVPSAAHKQLASLFVVPAAPLAPATQLSPVDGASLSLVHSAEQSTFPTTSSLISASAAAALSSASPLDPVRPEHVSEGQATTTNADSPRLSEPTMRELAALLAHSPLRYLDAAGAPLLSMHRFASLSQLRSVRCQQSHVPLSQPSHVYVPADSLLPRSLHRYFVAQPAPPQPATRDQMDKMLLTAELIDDERPVADWQLDDEAHGTAWAPACQRFVRERRFEAGMDGREAFMAAVREMAEARQQQGGKRMQQKLSGKRRIAADKVGSARKRVASDTL